MHVTGLGTLQVADSDVRLLRSTLSNNDRLMRFRPGDIRPALGRCPLGNF